MRSATCQGDEEFSFVDFPPVRCRERAELTVTP